MAEAKRKPTRRTSSSKGRSTQGRKDFGSYQYDAATWITLATGEYYPDILPEACELYKPVLVLFD